MRDFKLQELKDDIEQFLELDAQEYEPKQIATVLRSLARDYDAEQDAYEVALAETNAEFEGHGV